MTKMAEAKIQIMLGPKYKTFFAVIDTTEKGSKVLRQGTNSGSEIMHHIFSAGVSVTTKKTFIVMIPGLDGGTVGVDQLPGDEVLDGPVGGVEPVPGEQDCQERGGVEHQRRHRVEEVGVEDEKRFPVGGDAIREMEYWSKFQCCT